MSESHENDSDAPKGGSSPERGVADAPEDGSSSGPLENLNMDESHNAASRGAEVELSP